MNGTFSCTWYIPNDLPVWDIRGEYLQIEVYAQSRNLSPEGKNDVVLLRDDVTFTSNWNNPLLENSEEGSQSEEVVASQNLRIAGAFAWGAMGILAGLGLMYKLNWRVKREYEGEKVPMAFEGGAVYRVAESLHENE